jgi:putative N6-adenine-specific DNA methylase
VPGGAWAAAREEARDAVVSTRFEAFASDIDPACVALSRENARRAGVSDLIRVFRADAREICADGRRGTIVTNPPYGERMTPAEGIETLYRELGVRFRALAPWQVYVISSCRDFERLYGKRADKIRKLYNGMLPCYLYQYFKNTK